MICRSMKNKFTYIWLSMSDGSWGWKKYLIHGDFGGDEVEEVEIMGMKKLGFEKRKKPNKNDNIHFLFLLLFYMKQNPPRKRKSTKVYQADVSIIECISYFKSDCRFSIIRF